ncbi:MAG: polysaccharide biosynthesis C-terminal domain-containing protein [Bacteroidota bacterium]
MINQKKIIWSLFGNGVDIAIGFGTVMLITRLYSEETAGQWFVFVAIFSLLTNLREGFIQNGLVKYSVGTEDTVRNRVYKTNFLVNLLAELTISAFVVGFFQIFRWYQLDTLFLYYPLYSLPYSVYRWIFVVHRSQLRVEKSTLMNVIFLVILSSGAWLMYTQQYTILAMIFTLGTASLGAAITGFFSLDARSVFRSSFDRQIFQQLVHYGKHGILRELTGTISTRINIFLTAGLLSYTQTAYLGVAQRYVMLLLVPNTAFQALLYPVLVKIANSKNRPLLKEEFENQVSKLLGLMIVVALGIIVASPVIIEVLHGPSYQSAVGLLIISLFTVALFSPFGSAFGSVVNALEKPNINSKIVMVNSAINISLSYLLIRTIGLYGAVLAPFITELFGFIWTGIIIRKNANISYKSCFERIPHHYGYWIKKFKLTLAR